MQSEGFLQVFGRIHRIAGAKQRDRKIEVQVGIFGIALH